MRKSEGYFQTVVYLQHGLRGQLADCGPDFAFREHRQIEAGNEGVLIEPRLLSVRGGEVNEIMSSIATPVQVARDRGQQDVADALVVIIRLHDERGPMLGRQSARVGKLYQNEIAAFHGIGEALSASSNVRSASTTISPAVHSLSS